MGWEIGPIAWHWRFGWTGWTKPMSKWHYFTDAEGEGMDIETMAKFDRGRGLSGIPWVMSSGKRTPENNKSIIGAVPDSSHLTGHAGDFVCEDSRSLSLMMRGARGAGLNRFGIYVREVTENGKVSLIPTHLHIDDDPSKDPEVVWIKKEGTA